MRRSVPIFIPHYGNKNLLLKLIKLNEKYCNYPINYCIYDSSPNKLDPNELKNLSPRHKIFYRHINYNLKENTYPYVLRDFLLSDHYAEGAFILPHDELLIIDYESFNSVAEDHLFACGRQLSFCPDTKKVVEIDLSPFDDSCTAWDYSKKLYSPQYHATYLPRKIAHAYGIFLSKFIDIWGAKNTLFTDFVLLNILNRANIFYSIKSVYFKEQRKTRKTAGNFVHPSSFIKNISHEEKILLMNLLDSLWESIEISTKYRDKSISFLLKSFNLQKSLMLAGINNHKNLFLYRSDSEQIINYQSLDIFNGYHLISDKTDSDYLNFVFDGNTVLCENTNLMCLFSILNSYDINN